MSNYQRFIFVSLILLLGFFSCVTKTEEVLPKISKSSPSVYPAIPAELIGQEIDTIITFNAETFEESVRYEIHQPEKYVRIDTIITFNPGTYKESMTIIKHSNGQTDTIEVY